MTNRLPDFSNPPLIEVVLSVQFEAIEKLRTPQIGMLWNKFRNEFPSTQEHPPLEQQFEIFGMARASRPNVQLQMIEGLPVPRVWFLNNEGTELIQIQQDRFVHNWRKIDSEDQYPRYMSLRSKVKSELQTFTEILREEKWGELVPNQCEVTYVNHIHECGEWNGFNQIGRVVSAFDLKLEDSSAREFEEARLAMTFVLKDKDLKPIGRLHVSAQPACIGDTLEKVIVLTITARLSLRETSIDGVLDAWDRGRQEIVIAFAELTQSRMHEVWGRTDVTGT